MITASFEHDDRPSKETFGAVSPCSSTILGFPMCYGACYDY